MIKRSYLVSTAALVLAVAACDQSTAPSGSLTLAEANQLAADMDAVATLGTADFGLGPSFSIGIDGSGSSAAVTAVPTTFSNTFDVTKPCPKGGNVQIAGSINGTGDRATRSLSIQTSATRTDKACAFQTRNGVVTVNGNPNVAVTGKVNIANGLPSGPQTATHKGSFTVARDGGAAVPCAVDITSIFEPATRTVKVNGKFCGRDVSVTRTRGS
jgi:hypothetical protein